MSQSEQDDIKTDSETDDQLLFGSQPVIITNSESNYWSNPDYKKTTFALQSDPRYHINNNKYFGVLRGYIRQDWDTFNLEDGLEEQRAQWIELFFDLIFVACIVHISSEAVYSIPNQQNYHRRLLNTDNCSNRGDYDFIFTCFAQFGLLTLFWIEQTMIESHFVLNQWIDLFLRLCFMSFVLSMGLFIHDDISYHIAFQISYIGLKIICIIIYIKSSLIPRAKIHGIWHIINSIIIIIALIFISIFYRGCSINYFVVYLCFFIFEYISNILEWTIMNKSTGYLQFALPLHVAHISERFGLFIMLILGEALISLITVNMDQHITIKSILDIGFIIATFIMSFVIAMLYFDAQPSEEDIINGQNNHALRSTNLNRLFYIYGHHQLFFGLLAYGIGIKIAAKHFFDSIIKREWIDIILPGYGLVIVVTALFIIRWTHPHKIKNKLIWISRFIILIIMCILPIFSISINQSIIFCIIFILILLLCIIDVEGHSQRKKRKHELKEKRKDAKLKSEEIHLQQINLQNNS